MAEPADQKTKPLSWVWSYFKPTEIAGLRYNVCHAPLAPGSTELCLKRMVPDKSGGTKSMGNHLERKHRLSKSDPRPLTPITHTLSHSTSSSGISPRRRINRDALLNAITHFIISANLPIQISNNQHFIDLLHLCNPLITRSLLAEPHHPITRSIHLKFIRANQALQAHLNQLHSSSFTITATISTPSAHNYSILVLVLHWVSDHPDLKSVLLSITQLTRKPSSRTIALAIVKTLNEYGLQKKIFSLTIDNVPDLDQFGIDLAKLLPNFKPHSQLIGCMAQLINRAAEIALDDFQPSDHPLHPPHHPLGLLDLPPQADLIPRTILSRLQDLTLSLRQSTQKTESFNRIVAAVTNNQNTSPLAGLTPTQSNSRWASTYQVLSHAYQIKEAIQIFCLKEADYSLYLIHDKEWELVRLVADFLKPLSVAANVISTDKACDMITATPTYCWLLRRLNKVQRNYEGRELPEPIKQMLEILNECSEKNNQRPVHIFGMILDPRIKMTNFEDQSSAHSQSNERINNHFMSVEEIRKAFYVCSLPYSQHPTTSKINHDPTHHHHHHHHLELHSNTIIKREQSLKPQQMLISTTAPNDGVHQSQSTDRQHPRSYPSDSDSDSDYQSGQPRIFKKKPKLMIGLEDEIANYLELECEESNCNPREYWRSNASKFPSLSQMAKDFLAIQASTGLAFRTGSKFNQLFEATSSADLLGGHPELPADPTPTPNQPQQAIDPHISSSASALQSLAGLSSFSANPRAFPDLIVPESHPATPNAGEAVSRMLGHPPFAPHHPPPAQLDFAGFQHPAPPPSTRRVQDILVDVRAHHLGLGAPADGSPGAPLPTATLPDPARPLDPANLDQQIAPAQSHQLDKLDAFAAPDPLFLALVHSLCVFDWCFVHQFIPL